MTASSTVGAGERSPVPLRIRVRAWRSAVVTGARRTLADRSGLVAFGLFFVMPPAVLAGMWQIAARANGGDIVGYDPTAIVWYIVTAETAILTIRNRLIEEVGDDIGSERIAVELIRPVPPLEIRLATETGIFLPRLALGIVLAGAVGLALAGPPPSATGWLLAIPAVLLGLLINLVAQHAFAGLAFWVRDAKGAWFLYQKLLFVLGGMLLPLEVLPSTIEAVAKATPFMAMAYAPSRFGAGFVEPWLFVVQLGWLAVLLVVASRVFAAGQRRMLAAEGS